MLSKNPEIHERRLLLLKWLNDERFEKPMELGGTDQSHHHHDLIALVKMGYAELGGYQSWHRRVNKYRRSQKGRDYLANV